MKITLKELRKIINEELMIVNAKTGDRFPVMDTKKISPKTLDRAKEIIFDFSNVDFLDLEDELTSVAAEEMEKKPAVEVPGVPTGWRQTPKVPTKLPVPPKSPEAPRRRR